MNEKQTLTVVEVEGVRGYIDDEGTAWLNAADVARGLGFVQVKKDRVPTSGDKSNLSSDDEPINEDNYYTVIRWERVNGYLREFGFPHHVGENDFIPENMFYRLAMKASNATAQKFQALVADKILPALRKHGYYSVKNDRSDSNSEQSDREQLHSQFKRIDLETKRRRDELQSKLTELSFQRINLFCDYQDLQNLSEEIERIELEQQRRKHEYHTKRAAFVEKIERMAEIYLR